MNVFAPGFTLNALIILFFLLLPIQIFGQSMCLSDEEAKKAVEQINKQQPPPENQKLRLELLDMQTARLKLEQKLTQNLEKSQSLLPVSSELDRKQLVRLCEIVKQNGWVTKESVGEDGLSAALSIVQNRSSVALKREIFPLIAAAAKKGYIGNNQLAPIIDNLRISQGLPQIFGTQAFIKDDLLYLYPLLNESKIEDYRKSYGLPTLSVYMKYLLYEYGMPVIRSPRLPTTAQTKEAENKSDDKLKAEQLPDLESDEVVKVESSLVNLNVRVSGGSPAADNPSLQKGDFSLFENGKQQDISFFSAADAPFDLVLLLDLSGSTSDKQNLIRKSTERFIEAARPSDRIAVVTFTDEVKIVSDLTQNKEELLKKVKKINDYGGSGVWNGLQFVFDKIIKPESAGRRSAVLMMTDGVDSSLMAGRVIPDSFPSFSDVLETVRSGETTVIPIYLDTEAGTGEGAAKAYRIARKTLSMFAEESGGQVYNAKKVSDLTEIYEQIVKDLGRVYSLGFEPSGINRDGTWHNLNVKIPNHPELTVYAKKGFYAK